MTTYAHREIVTRRIEYGIESGDVIGTFEKVKLIAFSDYCTRNGVDRDKGWSDHWATVEAREGEIVIWFAVETEQQPSIGGAA